MKKILRALRPSFFAFLLLMLSLSFTGCIEILEKLKVKPDQSGQYALEIDGGQLAGLMMLSGATEGPEVKALLVSLKSIGNTLRQAEGIHNVAVDTDLSDGKISFSFDFDDQKSLNKAFYAMADMEKKFFYPKIFKLGKKNVKRTNIAPFLRMYVKREYPELHSNDFLKQVFLVSSCSIPGEITKAKDGKINNKKNAARYRWTADGVINSKDNLKYKVKYLPGH